MVVRNWTPPGDGCHPTDAGLSTADAADDAGGDAAAAVLSYYHNAAAAAAVAVAVFVVPHTAVYDVTRKFFSKCETLTQRRLDVGPTAWMSAQHYADVVLTSPICRLFLWWWHVMAASQQTIIV